MALAVYKVKRLYNNYASIRTTTIDLCVERKVGLKVVFEDKSMVIPLEKLQNPDKFQIHKRIFRSKFNAEQYYELYDFPFIHDRSLDPTEMMKEKMELEKAYDDLQERYNKIFYKFVPLFGNLTHIQMLHDKKEVDKLLEKLKNYKAGGTRARSLIEDIKRRIGNLEYLKNKVV